MAHASMTYIDIYPKSGVLTRASTRVGTWAIATMNRIAENDPRLRQTRALQAMSDEQLAALGLARADIVRHVFRKYF